MFDLDLLSNDDKLTIAAVLRTHAELQDRQALQGTEVLARLQRDEPNNILTLQMREGLEDIEDDCANLQRIASLVESSIDS